MTIKVFSCGIYFPGVKGFILLMIDILSHFKILQINKKRSKQFARHSNTLTEHIYICCESHHEIWSLRGLVGKLNIKIE